MKNFLKIFVLLLLLHLPLSLAATGQEADIITIDGEKWYLLEKPLFQNSLLCEELEKILPADRSISSSNWEGYNVHWEIIGGTLYLKKVEVDMYENDQSYKLEYSAEDLKSRFASYYTSQGIRATWVNDNEFTVARGDVIIYFHDGFNRYHEEELIMTVKSGKITSRKYWRNSVHKDGMEIEGVYRKIMMNFPTEKFPILKGTRMIVFFKDIELNSDGSFKDCFISLSSLGEGDLDITDQSYPIIVTLKNMLSEYNWKVYLVRGNYMPKQKNFILTLRPKVNN